LARAAQWENALQTLYGSNEAPKSAFLGQIFAEDVAEMVI
jgi:hypothetical protein